MANPAAYFRYDDDDDMEADSEGSLSDDSTAPPFVPPLLQAPALRERTVVNIEDDDPVVNIEDDEPVVKTEDEPPAELTEEELYDGMRKELDAEFLKKDTEQIERTHDERVRFLLQPHTDREVRAFDKQHAVLRLRSRHFMYSMGKDTDGILLAYNSKEAKEWRQKCARFLSKAVGEDVLREDHLAWWNASSNGEYMRRMRARQAQAAQARSFEQPARSAAAAASAAPAPAAAAELARVVVSPPVRTPGQFDFAHPSRVVIQKHSPATLSHARRFLADTVRFFFFMRPMMLSEKLLSSRNHLKNWCWEIKLDGNRALWNGFTKTLTSSSGKVIIKPPAEWCWKLPEGCVLDGELFRPVANQEAGTITEFAGDLAAVSNVWKLRGKQGPGYTVSTMHSKEWMQTQFHAFDVPSAALVSRKLSERQIVLDCIFELHGGPNEVLKRIGRGTFQNKLNPAGLMDEINMLLKHYAALGAEGIVLKNLDSVLTSQASATREWLKAKVYEDVEARVLRLYQGKDKEGKPRKGVFVELPSGVEQGVLFANDNLIAHDKLQPGMLVRLDFMPESERESGKKRTLIIRAIVTDTVSWEEIKTRELEKQREAQAD
jgi:hypothetical protein